MAKASEAAALRTVVNCAGIGPSMRILGRKGVHDLNAFTKVIQISLIGTFNVLAVAAEAIAATEPDENGQRVWAGRLPKRSDGSDGSDILGAKSASVSADYVK